MLNVPTPSKLLVSRGSIIRPSITDDFWYQVLDTKHPYPGGDTRVSLFGEDPEESYQHTTAVEETTWRIGQRPRIFGFTSGEEVRNIVVDGTGEIVYCLIDSKGFMSSLTETKVREELLNRHGAQIRLFTPLNPPPKYTAHRPLNFFFKGAVAQTPPGMVANWTPHPWANSYVLPASSLMPPQQIGLVQELFESTPHTTSRGCDCGQKHTSLPQPGPWHTTGCPDHRA